MKIWLYDLWHLRKISTLFSLNSIFNSSQVFEWNYKKMLTVDKAHTAKRNTLTNSIRWNETILLNCAATVMRKNKIFSSLLFAILKDVCYVSVDTEINLAHFFFFFLWVCHKKIFYFRFSLTFEHSLPHENATRWWKNKERTYK